MTNFAAIAQQAVAACAQPQARALADDPAPHTTINLTRQIEHVLLGRTWEQRARALSLVAINAGHSILVDGTPMREEIVP